MEAKLKLAFKNFFEKYLSKDKYTNNEIGAAQKALKKVKEMREARMFNISLYKYKGAVKGIKVVAKNPNTPHITKEDPSKKEETEEMKAIPEEEEQQEKPKEEPAKEGEPEPEPEPEPVPDPNTEELEPPRLMTEEQIKELMRSLLNIKPQDYDNGEEEDEDEEEKEEEQEEEEEEEAPEEPPKPVPRAKANIPRRRRLSEVAEEVSRTKPQKPKIIKQVRPVPPRTPRVVKQKYLNPKPLDRELIEFKPKIDYKNNKSDRIQALYKLTYAEI